MEARVETKLGVADILKDHPIKIRITRVGWFTRRIRIASWLIRFGAWILGTRAYISFE